MAEIKTNKVNYIDSKKTSLVFPIIFLVLVIALTVSLFFYNSFIQKQVEDLKIKTAELNKTAETISNKSEVQVYTLIDNNRSVISELEKRSKITAYIDHIESLESPQKYGINFDWFTISKWEITTTASTQSTLTTNSKSWSLAYEKTANFIKEYRNDPEAILNLDFISLIEWMDSMKYNVKFSIK